MIYLIRTGYESLGARLVWIPFGQESNFLVNIFLALLTFHPEPPKAHGQIKPLTLSPLGGPFYLEYSHQFLISCITKLVRAI